MIFSFNLLQKYNNNFLNLILKKSCGVWWFFSITKYKYNNILLNLILKVVSLILFNLLQNAKYNNTLNLIIKKSCEFDDSFNLLQNTNL
jgi:hypothetical protein